MAKIQDIDIPYLEFAEAAAPGTGASAITRIYTKADGLMYSKDDAGVETLMSSGPAGGTAPTAARYTRSSGNYTTSSATFVDVDATNLALSITTLARRVQIGFVGTCYTNNTSGIVAVDVTVDGTRQGGDYGLQLFHQHATTTEGVPLSFVYLTAVLSAGSHTFKLQWRLSNASHTATMYGSTTEATSQFWVQETLSTT